MDEQLGWKYKKKLNFTKVLDKIAFLTETVVKREVTDVSAKIEALCAMGIIQDNEKIKELKDKLSKINLDNIGKKQ